ncbi:MAG TPA: hypothetical protein ACN46L_01940 [Prochlorococcus sp.]
MTFIEFLDHRFTDSQEIKEINHQGISAGFDGFREVWELDYLYEHFEAEIHKIIEDTGYKDSDLEDEFDNEETLRMKLVWFAVSTYCLSRIDALVEQESQPG